MFSRSVASTASVPKRQAATLSSGASAGPLPSLNDFRTKIGASDNQCNLAELWDTFLALRDAGGATALDTNELFTLGGKIAKSEEVLSTSDEATQDSLHWGQCLQDVLVEIQNRKPFRSSAEAFQFECFTVQAQALRGHFEEAASMATRLQIPLTNREQSSWILDTYRHTLLSLLRYSSPLQAFEFYLDNSVLLKQLLNAGASRGTKTLARSGGPFFNELSAIFRMMDSPVAFLVTRRHSWDRPRMTSAGRTMLHVLSHDNLPEDALAVYEELELQSITVFYYLVHGLVRALTKAERFERANTLYSAIAPKAGADESERKSYDAAGLYLHAHQGNVARAEESFARLSARGRVSPQDMTLVMHANAMHGNIQRVTKLFEDFFGPPGSISKGESTLKPNVQHYGVVIHAYAKRDDFDGMNDWLGRMTAVGHNPDVAIYNVVLKGITQRDDVLSMRALFDQMREVGVSPDLSSYTTIIKVLARRRDVIAAEAMFKRMIREGIVPDRMVVTTVMNAHVEAGSWKGVIRVFDYLRGMPTKELRLGIEVFNTLLKAYVLIGAPLDVVTGIFRRLEMNNVRPTNRTFSLLIQSACDSGRMDVASRLFVEMEALSQNWTSNVQVNAHALTIIMAGYLRKGMKPQARAVYDDMQARGIQPTAYTFASILRAYSNVKFEDNLRIAQEFLSSLTSMPAEERAWVKPGSGRESSLAFVYAPLLQAHMKNLNTEEVERLYAEFVKSNRHPTIGILALLLDVYRRTDNIAGVHHIWPQILEFALGRTDEVDPVLGTEDTQSPFFKLHRRTDLLCIPLSIYIDAVSRAGQHIEIAHTWKALREKGFQFDAHNWNHLAVALVRAGQPARAFEVVEKVILPYQTQAYSVQRSRPEEPDSPLLFEDDEAREELEDEPFAVQVRHSYEKRAELMRRLKRRVRPIDSGDDYAHELHLMQQISPAWNVWRPHSLTLRVLAGVLNQLDAGRPVEPAKPIPRSPGPVYLEAKAGAELHPLDEEHVKVEESVEDEEHVEDEEPVEDEEFVEDEESAEDEETREARKNSAHEMLQQILTDNPRTVRRIDRWERGETTKVKKRELKVLREGRRELWDRHKRDHR